MAERTTSKKPLSPSRRCCFWPLFLVILSFFSGPGCNLEKFVTEGDSNPNFTKPLVPVRYMQINTPDLKPVYNFRPGEIPAIRVQCHTTVQGLLVMHKEGNRIVQGRQLDLQPGKILYQPFPELVPGTYTASILTTENSKQNSCDFSILDH